MRGKLARRDLAAAGVFLGAVALMVALIWSGNMWVLVAIIAGVTGILMGKNRGLPYLLGFAVLCSFTGIKTGTVTIGDFFALGAIAFGLFGRFVRRERVPLGWVYLAPVALLLWGLTVAVSRDVPAMPVLIFAGSMIVVLAAVTLPIHRPEQLEIVVAAFVLGATINAGSALLDYMGVFDTALITGASRQQVRPPGFTTHSNQLGLVTNLALPFAYYLAGKRKVWLVAVFVLFGGALASGSRGALIGVGLVTLLYILTTGRARFRKLVGAAVAIGASAFIALEFGVSNGLTRLTGADESAEVSDTERLRRIEAAWREFQANPITGVGYTNAEAHNFYLELLRSGGIVSLVIVVVFAAAILRAGWNLRGTYPVAIPAVAAAAAWFILAVQNNALNLRFIWFPIAVIAACVALNRVKRPERVSVR